MNNDDPKRKLKIIIENFVDAIRENPTVDFVNEMILHRIIIAESLKVYHTKAVNIKNK